MWPAIFMLLLSCDSKNVFHEKYSAISVYILLAVSLPAQPFLHTKGRNIVTSDGKPFVIKGTNLGNWLVPEGYMFHYKKATSPRLINETLTELIGPYETEKFWQQYVRSYITQGRYSLFKNGRSQFDPPAI